MSEQSAPHPYDRHIGRYGRDLAARMVELARVSRGDRVLDVGCGTGLLTAELARVVGAENVAAVDIAEAVADACRTRVPGADVRVATAETLPFADREFDAVLAQLVVNLVPDPELGVCEMARVTRPGGAVVACLWDNEEMPLLRSLWDAARAVAPEAVAQVDERTQVGLADVQLLREWWMGAGLRDIVLGELEVAASYESFDDLWAPFEAGVGRSGRLYAGLPPEQRAAMRAEVHRRLGSPEDPFRLVARARTVRGTREPVSDGDCGEKSG